MRKYYLVDVDGLSIEITYERPTVGVILRTVTAASADEAQELMGVCLMP